MKIRQRFSSPGPLLCRSLCTASPPPPPPLPVQPLPLQHHRGWRLLPRPPPCAPLTGSTRRMQCTASSRAPPAVFTTSASSSSSPSAVTCRAPHHCQRALHGAVAHGIHHLLGPHPCTLSGGRIVGIGGGCGVAGAGAGAGCVPSHRGAVRACVRSGGAVVRPPPLLLLLLLQQYSSRHCSMHRAE